MSFLNHVENSSGFDIVRVDSVVLGGSDRPSCVISNPDFETLKSGECNYPVIRCDKCEKILFIYTFYENTVIDDEIPQNCRYVFNTNDQKLGRTIICGSVDLKSVIIMEATDIQTYSISSFPNLKEINAHYCGCCPGSTEIIASHEKTLKSYYEMDHPYQILDTYSPEKNRIEQLNCSEDCDGQCLINIFCEYIDRRYHSRLVCSLCNEVMCVANTMDPETYIDHVSKIKELFSSAKGLWSLKLKKKEKVGTLLPLSRDHVPKIEVKGIYPHQYGYIVCGGFIERFLRIPLSERCEECTSSLSDILGKIVISEEHQENQGIVFKYKDFNYIIKSSYPPGFLKSIENEYVENISKDCLGGNCRGECLQAYIKSDRPSTKSHHKR